MLWSRRTLAIALLSSGLVFSAPGTPASAIEPQARLRPCAVGVPLEGDFDGDLTADLVVSSEITASGNSSLAQYLSPADGGTASWITRNASLRSADLNGDICADAILYSYDEPALLAVRGTPDGLDLDNAVEVPLPQSDDLTGELRRWLEFEAAGLRHDGISQIAVAGTHVVDLDEDGPENYGAFVDIVSLDDSFAATATQTFTFDEIEDPYVGGFGSAIAASGRTLAVGHPDAKVSGKELAGAVYVFTTSSADPTDFVLRKKLTQNSAGVPGRAESCDRFGESLALLDGRLAIGVPGEADGRIRDTGLVQPIRWSEAKGTYTAYRAISQDTKGVPDRNETDDAFGSHLAIARGLTATGSYDILIGADESLGKRKSVGSVTVANFTKAVFRSYSEASSGMPGSAEAYDNFSRVGVLRAATGADVVLIGGPGEDTGGVQDVGRVVRSDGKQLSAATSWTSIPIPPGAPTGMTGWGTDFGAAQ